MDPKGFLFQKECLMRISHPLLSRRLILNPANHARGNFQRRKTGKKRISHGFSQDALFSFTSWVMLNDS